MKQFYILVDKQQEGPLTLVEVVERSLSDDTLIWCKDWTKWETYSAVKEQLLVEHAALQQSGELYYLSSLTERLGAFTLDTLRQQPHLLDEALFAWKPGASSWLEVEKYEELRCIKERTSAQKRASDVPQNEEENSTQSSVEPPIFEPKGYKTDGREQTPPREEPVRATQAESLWRYFTLGFTERFFAFSGRARRQEFWGFFLFYYAFSLVFFNWRMPMFFTDIDIWHFDLFPQVHSWLEGFCIWNAWVPNCLMSILYSLLGLICLIPFLAVAVRRLHDIDYSAWYLLFALIPVIGWFFLFIFFCKDGTKHPNRYGPSPKYVAL